MDDPRVRRHDREVVEGLLAPAQELVALLVALELALGVQREGLHGAERVDLHRVVDDELGGNERVDLRRVAAEGTHGVAHRREIDDRGHPGEVLHDDAGGGEGDLLGRLRVRVPRGERLDVLLAHGAVALGAQEVLQQHFQGERQARDVERRLECIKAVDRHLTPGDLEGVATVEGVRVLAHDAPGVRGGG